MKNDQPGLPPARQRRRKYTAEFQQEAVRLAKDLGDGVEAPWPTQHQLGALQAGGIDQVEPGAGAVPSALELTQW